MDGEFSSETTLGATGKSPSHTAGCATSAPFFPLVGKRLVILKPGPADVLAQCPGCKTVETVQVVGDVLTRCRRFSQRGAHIYHDCGSEDPCRFHRVSPGSASRAG